jgi:NitT/TauT family transport system substrate-binding protein
MRKFKKLVSVLAAISLPCLAGVSLFSLSGCSDGDCCATDPNPTQTIKIGTLQTDDILPLWAAVAEGIDDKHNLDLQIITFASAAEQIAAVTAGEVDAIMTDMVVPVQLSAAGTPMRSAFVLQTAPAGIVVRPGSTITSLSQLNGVPVGGSSPTAMEYIFETALANAGVPPEGIVSEEIKKLPVRLEMLLSGNIEAAVLPWTLHALAVERGAISLLGVEEAAPITSTVLAFTQDFVDSDTDNRAIKAVIATWDEAVARINVNPESYRVLLAEKAMLPEPLDTTYPVRQYPLAAVPSQEQFEAVVAWMVSKEYIAEPIPYAALIHPGAFTGDGE